jgi:hypothetical protein
MDDDYDAQRWTMITTYGVGQRLQHTGLDGNYDARRWTTIMMHDDCDARRTIVMPNVKRRLRRTMLDGNCDAMC